MQNNMEKLVVSSSPHIRSNENVQNIMIRVCIALIPCIIAGVYFFGIRVVTTILLAIMGAMGGEAIACYAKKMPISLSDGSAVLTGLLLGLIVPPGLPMWMILAGGLVATLLGKQVFGGIGQNPFNPALVGRVFLLLSFGVVMTNYLSPESLKNGVDAVSSATPLALMQMEGISTPYWDMFIGNIGGCIGETSAIAILIGGIYLIITKVIDWKIPAGYIGTVAVLSFLIPGQDPIFQVLAGGLLFGAFFMATDYVTTPITGKGRLIFAIGCGIITSVIRFFGSYPDGVMFSILIMNAVTPVINRFTVPRIYGAVKVKGVKAK